MGNESNTVLETQFVLRRLEEALRIFGKQVEAKWFWAFVLGLILLVGFAYVIAMYRRDSRSVGVAWASLLGLMRCCVYLILGAVFLLPAWQTWEKTETHSKVVLAIDVSDSMRSRDDMPTESMPAEKLPTRLDKVQEFLLAGNGAFLRELQAKNPVYLYRFGSRADEQFHMLDKDKPWTAEEWSAWLRPNPKQATPEGLSDPDRAAFLKRLDLYQQLTNGTNLGDSLLEIVNREANNKVQGLIVFTDGRSTQYSAQSFTDLKTRAKLADMRLLTVGVGDYRRPISIRLAGVQAPGQARPDDKFPVRVELEGDGLANKELVVYLDVTSPSGAKQTLERPFKFSAGTGGPPNAQVEFEMDAAKLAAAPGGAARSELEEGAWSLVARIPKDKREIFFEKEHLSGKQIVQVVKKPLRVLLFAGAASRDYQFVRNLLIREADQRKAEVSVCIQNLREGVVQDVPPDRLLKSFPARMSEEPGKEATDRYANLAEYDLVIAFDPDWSLLQSDQLAALEKWINMQAGGLILVAGPVNTFNLARPANRDKLKPVLDLLPVALQDSRLQSLSNERSSTEPWRLHFPGASADMEFLILDEEIKEPLPGWEEFFTGKTRAEVKPTDPTVRGFFSYYPVDGVKPSATVIATFADPRAKMRGSDKEQPYLAAMPFGSGKVVYLGSGETWRLRGYRELYFERFWLKLARYAGSGNLTRLSRRGVLVMGQQFSAGQYVTVEAQLFGRDLRPLPQNLVPKVELQPPPGVTMPTSYEMRPKPTQGSDWTGWFQTRFRVMSAGEYRLDLRIPETGDSLPGRFSVKEANPELDDTRPDFTQLYTLASELTEGTSPLEPAGKQQLRKGLEATAARLLQKVDDHEPAKSAQPSSPVAVVTPAKDSAADSKDMGRLFFDLESANLLPACMVTRTNINRNRGPVKDIWDEGFTLVQDPSVRMAWVLVAVVGLLSLEWLARKLLRLA